MEVIRHGNTYKEIKCPRCGAILSYCYTDIKTDNRRETYYNGEYHYSYRKYINCPECEGKIELAWIKE